MKKSTYHKTLLSKILKDADWKLKESQKSKGTFFINYITKYHMFEKMLDSDGYLYPRGYDLLVNVLIPGEKAAQLCGARSSQDFLEIYLMYDIRWLKQWVQKVEEQKGVSFRPYPTTDLTVTDFKLAWLLDYSHRLDTWFNRHPDFQEKYIYKKESRNWITKEGARALLESLNVGEQVRRMSLFVAEHYTGLRSETAMISSDRHHKNHFSMKAVSSEYLEQTGEQFYDLHSYYFDADSLKRRLKSSLTQNHPHENWLLRRKADQRGKVGHLVVPFIGVNWFQTVFLPWYKKGNEFIRKDIEWTIGTMKRLQIEMPKPETMTVHTFKKVFALDDQIAWYLFHTHCPQVIGQENATIPVEVIQEMEQRYPLLYLRHLSYVCSPKTSIKWKAKQPEAADKPGKRSTYMDVQELMDRFVYKGRIIHRTSTIKDQVNKVPLRRVPVELEDHRKVRLMIPEWILEGHFQRQFLVPHAPIQFRLEKTKDGHKRVCWFEVFDGIMLQLDWSQSAIDHVAISKGVKTKKKTVVKKEKKKQFLIYFTPDEYEFLCQYQKKWKLPTLVYFCSTLIDRFLFEERKLDHLQKLKEQAIVHQKELEEFERKELGLSEAAYTMIHDNILERNQSFENYIQGYEELFCRKSNLEFRKLTSTNGQKRTIIKSMVLGPEKVQQVHRILNALHFITVRDWFMASLVDLPEQKLWKYKEMLDANRNGSEHLSRGLLTWKQEFHEKDYRLWQERFQAYHEVLYDSKRELMDWTDWVIREEGYYDRHSKVADQGISIDTGGCGLHP